jgi:hypothetical protein
LCNVLWIIQDIHINKIFVKLFLYNFATIYYEKCIQSYMKFFF